MEQLDSQLSVADVTLDTPLFDRIDEIVHPGVNLNPADALRRAGTQAATSAAIDGTPAARRRPPDGRQLLAVDTKQDSDSNVSVIVSEMREAPATECSRSRRGPSGERTSRRTSLRVHATLESGSGSG
jgi:hypothetical protein